VQIKTLSCSAISIPSENLFPLPATRPFLPGKTPYSQAFTGGFPPQHMVRSHNNVPSSRQHLHHEGPAATALPSLFGSGIIHRRSLSVN
jgi:hypothetical protein